MRWIHSRARTLVIVSAAALLLTSSVIAAPRPAPAPQADPQGLTCQLSPDPQLPLELNTVALGGLFKTIAMEKEIFICGGGAQIRDLETFIELVQDTKGRLVEPPRIELATCLKSLGQGTVSCRVADLHLSAATDVPLQGCDGKSHRVPTDPVEMNSAATQGIVKTIKVEKEIFRCTTPNGGVVIRDVYVFAEILEQRVTLTSGATSFKPFAKKFIGIVCDKDESAGRIVSCRRFRT